MIFQSKEHVLDLWSASDVVQNLVTIKEQRFPVDNHADMSQSASVASEQRDPARPTHAYRGQLDRESIARENWFTLTQSHRRLPRIFP